MSRVGVWFCLVLIGVGPLAYSERLPAGTRLEIRLQQQISTFSSTKNTKIDALLIAPIRRDNHVLLPLGAKISGHVVRVQRVGIGISHETAALVLQFDRIELPNGRVVGLPSRILEVENARETVDAQGKIQGVHATKTVAYRSAGVVNILALSNPIGLMFTTAASVSVLRFSEPEIYLPRGTELVLETLNDIEVVEAANSETPPLATSEADRAVLADMVAQLPFRTYTRRTSRASDLTNLVFIGNRDALQRSLAVAGWVAADALTAQTAYRTLRSVMENQGYQSAPMSMLLLDGRQSDYLYSKTLDTFSKRHHMRIWSQPATWKGEPVWTASSTQDIGIAFSRKQRTFIHLIDTNVDSERAKVVNDLVLAGCADAVNLVTRPWVPLDARNATGEELVTDGNIAVIHLNDCPAAQNLGSSLSALPPRGSLATRVTRQTVLSLKNNLVRENAVWMGYSGIKRLRQPKTSAKILLKRQIELDGESYLIENPSEISSWTDNSSGIRNLQPRKREETSAAPENQRWAPALVEIGFHGGFAHYASNTLGQVQFAITEGTGDSFALNSGNRLADGWDGGVTVTLNPHRYLSHEFAFDYQRTKFRMVQLPSASAAGDLQTRPAGVATAQFGYNLLVNLRPKSSRWRPYLAAGPALQLTHLTSAPLKKAPAYFKIGLQNIGIISAAYDFGSSPPLQGGGIFQPALQYGAGFRVRLAPRWMWRADFRETLTSQPDFWAQSAETMQKGFAGDPQFTNWAIARRGPSLGAVLRQQRVTTGFSFAF